MLCWLLLLIIMDTTARSPQHTQTKRLKDGTVKSYVYNRIARKQYQIDFVSEEEKNQFETKLQEMGNELGLKRSDVFKYLLGFVTSHSMPVSSSEKEAPTSITSTIDRLNKESSAMYLCSTNAAQQLMIMTEKHARICEESLLVQKELRHGHIMETHFICRNKHKTKWFSSSETGGNFILNYRMYLAFTCSGILPVQFDKLCKFANLGTMSQRLSTSMQDTFRIPIEAAAELSMAKALSEELAKTGDNNRIDIMADARHPCRTNSHRTDVPALGQLSHKVVAYAHVTRNEDPATQRHETLGVKKLFNYFREKNVKIGNIAHDRNISVNKYVKEKEKGVYIFYYDL